MLTIRRDLHRHPELAFEEFRTALGVERELRHLSGKKIWTGVGKTENFAQLDGNQVSGKVVMLRFDMDSLPIQVENDVGYASIVPNVKGYGANLTNVTVF